MSAICWDQWFPEAARAMALQGAEILLYPTAIGSEPQDGGLDSRDHWKRVMQGHAGANLVIVSLQHVSEYICFHLSSRPSPADLIKNHILVDHHDPGASCGFKSCWERSN